MDTFNDLPKLSLVTALYKSDRYLPGYFRHLYPFVNKLRSLGVDVEVVFVPQKPSDLEKKYLEQASANTWCRIYEGDTPSLYMAWNIGTLMAKGDVVGFWNADDWRYIKGTLEALSLFKQGAELVYSPFRIRRYMNFFGQDILVFIKEINKQVPEFNNQTYPTFLYQMHCGPFFMFDKKLYAKVGPFDEQFKIVGDFDWCIRAAAIKAKLVRGRGLLGSFRVDGRGVSSGGRLKHMAENNIVYIRHKQTCPKWSNTENFMKLYDPGKIFFQGQGYEVDSEGLFKKHLPMDKELISHKL